MVGGSIVLDLVFLKKAKSQDLQQGKLKKHIRELNSSRQMLENVLLVRGPQVKGTSFDGIPPTLFTQKKEERKVGSIVLDLVF